MLHGETPTTASFNTSSYDRSITYIDVYPTRRRVNSQFREHQHMADMEMDDSCKRPGDKNEHASQKVVGPTSPPQHESYPSEDEGT